MILVALLLTGCASKPPPSRHDIASSMTSPALCYVGLMGNLSDKEASQHELAVRRFKCSAELLPEGKADFQRWQAMQGQAASQQAQREADKSNLLMGIGAALLMQPPPPRPVQCQTDFYGRTTCW